MLRLAKIALVARAKASFFGLEAPSLAEGGWGWVDFALAKFALLDFAFARLATLDFSFAISTLLESAFAKSAMLESFVAFFVVDCHALRCNARNDKVAFFKEAGDLDTFKDTHPQTPSAREGALRSVATLSNEGVFKAKNANTSHTDNICQTDKKAICHTEALAEVSQNATKLCNTERSEVSQKANKNRDISGFALNMTKFNRHCETSAGIRGNLKAPYLAEGNP